MTTEKREIVSPEKEVDVPPPRSLPGKEDMADLSPKEKRDWLKWLKNLDFIKYLISIMLILYIVDIVLSINYPGAKSALNEPFFEALKTLLFTAAGYVFAKSSE